MTWRWALALAVAALTACTPTHVGSGESPFQSVAHDAAAEATPVELPAYEGPERFVRVWVEPLARDPSWRALTPLGHQVLVDELGRAGALQVVASQRALGEDAFVHVMVTSFDDQPQLPGQEGTSLGAERLRIIDVGLIVAVRGARSGDVRRLSGVGRATCPLDGDTPPFDEPTTRRALRRALAELWPALLERLRSTE